MPPLWRLNDLVELSDKHPSGLQWTVDWHGYHKGDPVVRRDKKTGYYILSVDGEVFLAHRIVYYLRTGKCPDTYGIDHLPTNTERDNRLELRPVYTTKRSKIEKDFVAFPVEQPEVSVEESRFVYIPKINELTDEELDQYNYYRGFQCAYGHTIRHKHDHWCYECVYKIQGNVCAFDISFLHRSYKFRAQRLWNEISIGAFDECWEINRPGKLSPKRVCWPSYRSHYSNQTAESTTVHKAIYQMTWGDVGSCPVTRLCGNPWCGNPLHMTSRWHRTLPPSRVYPFCREMDAEKIMMLAEASRQGLRQEAISQFYRSLVRNPLEAVDAPDYDEG